MFFFSLGILSFGYSESENGVPEENATTVETPRAAPPARRVSRPKSTGSSSISKTLKSRQPSSNRQNTVMRHDNTSHIFKQWPVRLQTIISKRILRRFDGELGVYVKDLASQTLYTLHAHTPMYMASVVKIYIMIALFHEVMAGRLKLDQTIAIDRAMYRDGAGKINWLKPGKTIRLERVLEWMMIYSDNAATDIIYNLIGPEEIGKILASLGFEGIGDITSMLEVRRQIFGTIDPRAWQLSNLDYIELWKRKQPAEKLRLFAKRIGKPSLRFKEKQYDEAYEAYYSGDLNTSTLMTIGEVLELMAEGNILNESYSAQMIDLLARCQTGQKRLQAGFPKKASFAHKTGTQHKVILDVGIVTLDDGRVLVVGAFAKNFKYRHEAERALADIGHAIARAFVLE